MEWQTFTRHKDAGGRVCHSFIYCRRENEREPSFFRHQQACHCSASHSSQGRSLGQPECGLGHLQGSRRPLGTLLVAHAQGLAVAQVKAVFSLCAHGLCSSGDGPGARLLLVFMSLPLAPSPLSFVRNWLHCSIILHFRDG